MNSAGTWLLGVRDFYNEDIGTLNQFSMKICQEEATYRNPLSITELFKVQSKYIQIQAMNLFLWNQT